MSSEFPLLPYGEGEDATAGWAGSDASRERAERERDDGTVSARQRQALVSLMVAGARGITWHELAGWQGWHHGQASGALSVLHKEARIARLSERRDRCHVYVLPEHVGERETEPHGRHGRAERAEEKLERIRALCEDGWSLLLDPTDILEILDS